eukprot:424737_1
MFLIDLTNMLNNVSCIQFEWLTLEFIQVIYFAYATFTFSYKLLLLGYFISFVLSIREMSDWKLNNSQARTFKPNSWNIASLILWPLQGILYSYTFPYSLCLWLYYSYFPDKSNYNYYNCIIQAASILHVRLDKNDNTKYIYELKQINWLYTNKLVDIFVKFDKNDIYEFTIDNQTVCKQDYIGALWIAVGAISHPIIHSYVNKNQLNNSNALFNLHSQFLNSLSYKFTAAWYGHDITVEKFAKSVEYNSKQRIPLSHIKNNINVKHYNDILLCRKVLLRHFKKYKLGNDFETYFICGFLHSIDHYYIWKNFSKSSMYYHGHNVGFGMFLYTNPLQIPFINSKLTTLRYYNYKWNELYHDLKKINKEMLCKYQIQLLIF